MRIALSMIASLLLLAITAKADTVDPADPVAGHAGVTYFDLMKLIVTDLDAPGQGEPKAHQIVPYRHIEGADAKTVPGGPVAIKFLTPLDIHADGAPRLALVADLGPSDGDVTEFVLLALFDMTDKPKLLDVVEVGRDQMTGFADAPLLPLGHGSDLIRIDSDHFNSDEDFVVTELIYVRNGRFRLLDALFTFDQKTCTTVETELPVVTTHPDAGRTHYSIVLAVPEKVARQPDAAQCDDKPPRPLVRTLQATYRWNERHQDFDKTSSDLEALENVNDTLNAPGPGVAAKPKARGRR